MINRNPGSSLKLGQARGVVLLAAAHAGLAVTEYASKTVKRAVVGTGAADKRQVAMMVRMLLPASGRVSGDAADALAVALCHAHHQAGQARLAAALAARRCRALIARLRGRLDSLGEDHAVIDVGGVGYLVVCSARTLAALPAAGEAVDLHVETQVRAESITLYGFREPAERVWFRLLQTVQGVGARVALGLLSVLAPDELARAVAAQDKAALARASGVGPRLAARIASELRERLVDLPLPAAAAHPLPGLGALAPAARRRCGLGADQPRLRPQRGPRRDRQGRRRPRRADRGRRPDPQRPQGPRRPMIGSHDSLYPRSVVERIAPIEEWRMNICHVDFCRLGLPCLGMPAFDWHGCC